jgi:hypothetical protein
VSYPPFFTASLDGIDRRISGHEETFTSLPRSSHRRLKLLVELANLRFERFDSSHDMQDLDVAILQCTHAIFLPFRHPTEHSQDDTVTGIFICLSRLLIRRSWESKQPRDSDVRYSVECLRHIRDRLLKVEELDITPRTRNAVTASLVCALSLQVTLENSDAMHGIEEMSVLCRELLSSDASQQELNVVVGLFSGQIIGHILHTSGSGQPSQQVIECLCKANTRLPDVQWVSMALSLALANRYFGTESNDDYECAMGHLDRFITSHFPVGGPNNTLRHHLGLAAKLAAYRSLYNSNQDHLEEAISRTRTHLGSISAEDSERGEIIQTLDELVRRRAERFGGDTGVPKGHCNGPVVDDLHAFSQLSTTLAELNNVKPPSMTIRACRRHLRAITSAERITDKAKVDEAVQYCRLLRPSLEQSPYQLADYTLLSVSCFLNHAFELTNELDYLNESIDICWSILKVRRAQWIHFPAIPRLLSFLSTRLRLSNDINDLDQMMQLFPIISNSTYTKAHERLMVIIPLAHYSRKFQHPLTSTIYNAAISSMSDSLVFAPTLEIQHFRLIQLKICYEGLPLDYASYQIQRGQLKEAIETLEQGRGLVWSQMREFRTPIDRLWMVNSHLAEEFASVNRELEALTTSASPSVLMNAVEVDDDEEMGSFGRVLEKHRKLWNDRNGLIAQIRALPGFENFLMALPFDTLRSAAARGPVIIINCSVWRCDIIILLYNSPPFLIPTADNFYNRAKGLREKLLAARKKGLDSMEYDDSLISVLKALYDLVGRLVIKRLRKLNIPEQSRIWWCPTSVFCSLPLHAMGPIKSRASGRRRLYFSDLYIPSYTPTLSALIDSRKPGVHSSEKPSILLVAQPDEFMPRAYDEISLIRRLDTAVTTLISKKATPLAVVQRLQNHRFAHFSCHGILETGKPFDASFKLYQGKRLTLLEIIRSRLPSAEFAFLSACHTAELTEKSAAGEGLHLTAAVQFAGFRSVVGTMWAMADIDGHDLAKHFYASVFSERWQDVPYYERTAEALRDAVRVLRRKKRMTTERWVNFVHYGA